MVTSNYNEQGTAKTEDESYQEAMADQAGIGPQEYMDALNGQLVETEDAGQVDTVSGATSSSEKFQEYAAMLLNAAENGEIDTLEVDNEVD
ncbi:MAG: FMN-binding protein [Alkalibacterium thalassium]|nr:FMN-binding protein [Alkalibacterium thalassium]